jgi:hypothetical protein
VSTTETQQTLLAEYHSAIEAFDDLSESLAAQIEKGTLPTEEDLVQEELARARLVMARRALWKSWRGSIDRHEMWNGPDTAW